MELKKRAKLVEQVSEIVASLPVPEKRLIFDQVLKEEQLPISIFRGPLSGLEAITVYLKEKEQRSIKEISKLLKREISTIYTTYSQAKKKSKHKKIAVIDHSVIVPLKIFSQRKFAVLESLVTYLYDCRRLSWKEIAQLLNKSYSTVRTVYNRYQKKMNKNDR